MSQTVTLWCFSVYVASVWKRYIRADSSLSLLPLTVVLCFLSLMIADPSYANRRTEVFQLWLVILWVSSRLRGRMKRPQRNLYHISPPASCSLTDRLMHPWLCVHVCVCAYVCVCVWSLTALQLHDAGLDVHREVLQIHGTGQDQCYSANIHTEEHTHTHTHTQLHLA